MDRKDAYRSGFDQGLACLESINEFQARLNNLWGESNSELKQIALEGFSQAKYTLEVMFNKPEELMQLIHKWEALKTNSKKMNVDPKILKSCLET